MSVEGTNELAQRRAKLGEYREQGINPFANDFRVDAVAAVGADDVGTCLDQAVHHGYRDGRVGVPGSHKGNERPPAL